MIYNIQDKKSVELASDMILNGEIIVYPTDTLYGLGVDATNSDAISSLNKLKNREQKYSIVLRSINEIHKYAYILESHKKYIQNIFPGPYTGIFKKRDSNLSPLVDLNSNTIGIRVPKSKFILDVVQYSKKPIITTSVNIHGKESIQNIKDIESLFSDLPIFSKYSRTNSNGSTIINFISKNPKILRQGDGEFII